MKNIPWLFISLPTRPSRMSRTRLPNAASGRFLHPWHQVPRLNEEEARTRTSSSSSSTPSPRPGARPRWPEAQERGSPPQAHSSTARAGSHCDTSSAPFLRTANDDSLDNPLDLTLDGIPNLVERLLGMLELAPKRLGVGLDAELVVRDAVAEVQARTEGEVGFEDEAELGEEAFAAGRGVRDEEAGFGLVVHLRGG